LLKAHLLTCIEQVCSGGQGGCLVYIAAEGKAEAAAAACTARGGGECPERLIRYGISLQRAKSGQAAGAEDSDAGPRYFLMKSEPHEFSVDELAGCPDQTHCWGECR
jgi:hypothetical protein